MIDNSRTYDIFELSSILAAEDDYAVLEPVYGDKEYDYGYADDGWPRPGPCPVCGAPDWTCVSDYYADMARLNKSIAYGEDEFGQNFFG